MLNIVLFGPPGAGKGTQSQNLIEQYGLVHLSTGDILRGEIKEGTDLGMKAKKLMDLGELVPDEVVIGMISHKIELNKHGKGFVFDGFPRTQAQAKALDVLLELKGTEITCMLALEVPDEELKARLLERGKSSGRPDDQNEEVIANRVAVYQRDTAPVKEYYAGQSKYRAVNGLGDIGDITARLAEAIDAATEV